jgi:hypothetical protein
MLSARLVIMAFAWPGKARRSCARATSAACMSPLTLITKFSGPINQQASQRSPDELSSFYAADRPRSFAYLSLRHGRSSKRRRRQGAAEGGHFSRRAWLAAAQVAWRPFANKRDRFEGGDSGGPQGARLRQTTTRGSNNNNHDVDDNNVNRQPAT